MMSFSSISRKPHKITMKPIRPIPQRPGQFLVFCKQHTPNMKEIYPDDLLASRQGKLLKMFQYIKQIKTQLKSNID